MSSLTTYLLTPRHAAPLRATRAARRQSVATSTQAYFVPKNTKVSRRRANEEGDSHFAWEREDQRKARMRQVRQCYNKQYYNAPPRPHPETRKEPPHSPSNDFC